MDADGGLTDDRPLPARAVDDFFLATNAEWLQECELPAGVSIDGTFRDAWAATESRLLDLIRDLHPELPISAFHRLMCSAEDPTSDPRRSLCVEMLTIDGFRAMTDLPIVLAKLSVAGVRFPWELTTRWSADEARHVLMIKPCPTPLTGGPADESISSSDQFAGSGQTAAVDRALATAWSGYRGDEEAASLVDLASRTGEFDWVTWVAAHGVDPRSPVAVEQSVVVGEMVRCLHRFKPRDIREWLLSRLVASRTEALPGEPWSARRVVAATRLTERFFGAQLAELLIRRHVSSAVRESVIAMAEQIRDAMVSVISGLGLPDDTAKALAGRIGSVQIGVARRTYAECLDYSFDVVGEAPEVLRRAYRAEFEMYLGTVGRTNRADWFPTRAYAATGLYDRTESMLFIPMGLLLPPFLDLTAPLPANFATLGTIIGHELAHAIDLAEWDSLWHGGNSPINGEPSRAREILERLIDQGRARVFDPASRMRYNLDLGLILNEVFCDHLGVASAAAALSRVGPGSSGSMLEFFREWVVMMREYATEAERSARLNDDPHPPAEVRCNWVLRNLDMFQVVAGVTTADRMWLSPGRRLGLCAERVNKVPKPLTQPRKRGRVLR